MSRAMRATITSHIFSRGCARVLRPLRDFFCARTRAIGAPPPHQTGAGASAPTCVRTRDCAIENRKSPVLADRWFFARGFFGEKMARGGGAQCSASGAARAAAACAAERAARIVARKKIGARSAKNLVAILRHSRARYVGFFRRDACCTDFFAHVAPIFLRAAREIRRRLRALRRRSARATAPRSGPTG